MIFDVGTSFAEGISIIGSHKTGENLEVKKSQKPNFLIIMTDGHGAHFSEVYGYRFIKTPGMQRLETAERKVCYT